MTLQSVCSSHYQGDNLMTNSKIITSKQCYVFRAQAGAIRTCILGSRMHKALGLIAVVSASFNLLISDLAYSQPLVNRLQYPEVLNPTINTPACYIQTNTHQTFDLSYMCGSSDYTDSSSPASTSGFTNGRGFSSSGSSYNRAGNLNFGHSGGSSSSGFSR